MYSRVHFWRRGAVNMNAILFYVLVVGAIGAEEGEDNDGAGEGVDDTANPDCTYRLEMMSAHVSFTLLECACCCCC